MPDTLPFLLANKTASWRAAKFHLADKVFPPARPRLSFCVIGTVSE